MYKYEGQWMVYSMYEGNLEAGTDSSHSSGLLSLGLAQGEG